MSRLSFVLPVALAVLAVARPAQSAPEIATISPTEGSALRTCCITINGSGFGDAAAQRSVTIGGVIANPVNWLNAFSVVAGLPLAGTPGATSVQVVVDGQASNQASYSVLGPPTIDQLATPYVVRAGGSVPITVRGTYFGSSSATPRMLTISGLVFGVTLDAVGDLVADVSTLDHSDDARDLTVIIDGQSGTLAGALAVLDPPVITSISPSAGRASGGTVITLRGDHFGPSSLTIPHSITINGAPFSSLAHVSNTSLTAIAPPGTPGSFPVGMTLGGTMASGSVAFQFLSPPHISSVTPGSGDIAGGYDITIVGEHFGPDDDAIPRNATVGGKAAMPIRWTAPEVLVVRAPAGDASGTVDVEVSIDGVTYLAPAAFTYSGISGAGSSTPSARLELAQNGPNPFSANQGTEIRFRLPNAGPVALEVFDPRGRLVARLASGALSAGPHSLRWDGRDTSGQPAPSGIYLYRLRAAGQELVRRMSLVR